MPIAPVEAQRHFNFALTFVVLLTIATGVVAAVIPSRTIGGFFVATDEIKP